MSREILLFKMASGETVVAEYLDSIDDQVIVSEPIALEVAQDSRGFSMLSTIWIPLHRKDATVIELSKMHIMAQVKVDTDMEKYYDKTVAYLRGDLEHLKSIIDSDGGEDEDYNTMSMINSDRTANTVVH